MGLCMALETESIALCRPDRKETLEEVLKMTAKRRSAIFYPDFGVLIQDPRKKWPDYNAEIVKTNPEAEKIRAAVFNSDFVLTRDLRYGIANMLPAELNLKREFPKVPERPVWVVWLIFFLLFFVFYTLYTL